MKRVLFAGLAAVWLMAAQDSSKAPAAEPAETAKSVMIAVDPVTHHIRQANPEEIAELSRLRARAMAAAGRTEGPTALRHLRHASGAHGVLLGESAMASVRATRQSDGTVAVKCDNGTTPNAGGASEK